MTRSGAKLNCFGTQEKLNLSATCSDNLYAVSDGGVRDWEGINSFQKSIAASPYVSEAWTVSFNGVFRANTLLDQLQKNGKRKARSIQSGYTFNSVAETRPFIKKYVDLTKVPTNNRLEWPINFIVYRYTAILLLKAECILRGWWYAGRC